MRQIIIILIAMMCVTIAQATPCDSTMKSHDLREAIYPLPLLTLGASLHIADDNYHNRISTQNSTIHKSTLDNVTQYAPGAIMLGLKLAGVEGRSSWERMITADAFAGVIYLTAVEGMKRSIPSPRPDGSDYRSFPSGHTSMAFLCATLLHKEYCGVSPWISFGGYSIASATAMARVLNNRHWQDDVLSGAAIGILSAQLGYFFSDLIFKQRGIKHFDTSLDPNHRPSHLEVSMGAAFALNSFNHDGLHLGIRRGVFTGISGAYYFTRQFGLGASASCSAYNVYDSSLLQPLPSRKSLQHWMCGIGPDFTLQLIPQLNFGARAHLNYSHYPTVSIEGIGSIGNNNGVGVNCDINFAIMPNETFSMRISSGYTLAPAPIKGCCTNAQFLTVAFSGAINF